MTPRIGVLAAQTRDYAGGWPGLGTCAGAAREVYVVLRALPTTGKGFRRTGFCAAESFHWRANDGLERRPVFCWN